MLGATDRAIRLIDRIAGCFTDHRDPELIEHQVRTLVGQRVYGLALGYEDLNDHDQLRHDPMLAVLLGKLTAKRSDCAPVAGKSTLNRLELSRAKPSKYHKISHDEAAIENLFVDLFMEAHDRPPRQIVLDLDATDDPLHGQQEGRFFHGYYDSYCYLPLYVTCGRHLLAAKLRRSNIDRSAGSEVELADRQPDQSELAEGAHLGARRFGVCARGSDGMVRGRRCGLCVRSGAQRSVGEGDRGAHGACPGGEPANRQAGAAFQGLPVDDTQQLEPPSPCRRQSGMDAGRGQPRFIVSSLSRAEVGARHL